ncbi:hypothetical protein CCACVL1_11546 [Corchorus capsularis]|uniref:Uncharacterized protein n=1 Tax=Corchorus capsularis TaxID=210143 RepID=A0A1R3IKM5_COCAP|nr:hypothetical protein CCACVL1_11546 [Corchorus capsularis]
MECIPLMVRKATVRKLDRAPMERNGWRRDKGPAIRSENFAFNRRKWHNPSQAYSNRRRGFEPFNRDRSRGKRIEETKAELSIRNQQSEKNSSPKHRTKFVHNASPNLATNPLGGDAFQQDGKSISDKATFEVETEEGDDGEESFERGFNDREDVDLDVFIPEDDMKWFERSVVVLINAAKNLSEVILAIKNFKFPVSVTEMSNVMLLLTVDEESLVDDCVKLVKDLEFDFFVEVAPWEFSLVQRCSIVWVKLEEIITGESVGIRFKIWVSVERDAGITRENNVFPVPVNERCINHSGELALIPAPEFIELSNDNALHVKEGFGIAENNDDCRTKVSTEEIVGESLNFYGEGSSRRVLTIYNPNGEFIEEEAEYVPNSFAGQHVSHPGGHVSQFDYSVSGSSIGVRSEGELRSGEVDNNFVVLGQRFKWVRCKVCDRKKKRKLTRRRCVTRLILGDKAIVDVSEASLSDDDIKKRNEVLLKEAEDTFDISRALGIEFCEERDAIISRQVTLDSEN